MEVNMWWITNSTSLPSITNVSKYIIWDILFSNIRTYFKKLWFSDRIWGASNDVLIFRWNTDIIYKKFLFYALSNNAFFEHTVKTSKWTKMPRWDKDAILKFPLLLPPLYEQRAIADILSSLDAKIELLREQNETLEKTAQTIFQEWFGRYSVDSPEDLPEGWRVGKLGEISEITSGKRPWEISEKITDDFQIPLIWASKIMWYVSDFLFDWKTLVIWRVGTHGEIQKFNEKIYPSDNTLVIKSNNFGFVYLILKGINYGKMNRWAVQPLITQTDLKNYPIIYPTHDIFASFKNATDAIFEKIENNNSQIQSLSKTRDELLPRLMSGEVRVGV